MAKFTGYNSFVVGIEGSQEEIVESQGVATSVTTPPEPMTEATGCAWQSPGDEVMTASVAAIGSVPTETASLQIAPVPEVLVVEETPIAEVTEEVQMVPPIVSESVALPEPAKPMTRQEAEHEAMEIFVAYCELLEDWKFHEATKMRRTMRAKQMIGQWYVLRLLEDLIDRGYMDECIPEGEGIEFKWDDNGVLVSEHSFEDVPKGKGKRSLCLLFALHSAEKLEADRRWEEDRAEEDWETRTVFRQNEAESAEDKLRREKEIARRSGGAGPHVKIRTNKTQGDREKREAARRARQDERARLCQGMKGHNSTPPKHGYKNGKKK